MPEKWRLSRHTISTTPPTSDRIPGDDSGNIRASLSYAFHDHFDKQQLRSILYWLGIRVHALNDDAVYREIVNRIRFGSLRLEPRLETRGAGGSSGGGAAGDIAVIGAAGGGTAIATGRTTPAPVTPTVTIKDETGTKAPCRIIALGKTRKFKAVGTPPGGSYQWTVSGNASIVGSSSGEIVEVKGDTVSAALDDSELEVAYTTAGGTARDSIELTVAEIDKIAVKVKATPALTARPGAVAPSDHDFDCTETAEAFPASKSLVLIRGDLQDVELQATVRPTDTPVWWDAKRAPDDHASLGGAGDLPTVKVDGSDPTKAKLKLDNKGSFFVRVFTDCAGSHKFDAEAAFRLLPTVLIDVTLHADNSVTSTGAFTATIAGGNVRISTGSFNIANVRAGTATAAIYMQAFADVTGGGPNGRRLLDCVFGGWINNLRSTIRSGQYAGPHVSQLVVVTNRPADRRFDPGDPAPVAPTMPLLDTGRASHGTGGDTATLTRSQALNADKVNHAVGQRWRVEAVDSPGGGQGLAHPNFPGALNRVHHEDNFTAFLAFWTDRGKTSGATADPANRVYGVIRTYQWRVLGEWTVSAAPALTAAIAPAVTQSAAATISPAKEANTANCEVRPPNIFDLLATDART